MRYSLMSLIDALWEMFAAVAGISIGVTYSIWLIVRKRGKQ